MLWSQLFNRCNQFWNLLWRFDANQLYWARFFFQEFKLAIQVVTFFGFEVAEVISLYTTPLSQQFA